MSCERVQERQALAQKILLYSRRYITSKCPILLVPIYTLREEVSPFPPGPLGTDGVHLWYHPEQVIQDYQKDRNSVAHQLLHVTIHCLMGHVPMRSRQKDVRVFDVVADWRTLQIIRGLDIGLEPRTSLELWEYRALEDLSLCQLLHQGCQNKEIRKLLRKLTKAGCGVVVDDHSLWNLATARQAGGVSGKIGELSQGESARGQAMAQGGEEAAPDWEGIRQALFDQAQAGDTWGNLAGMIKAEMGPAEENEISYEQFLRRFAVPNERLLLDPDSFDPRWYHLGLEQYGDIPLLEPSEISEPPAPDNIVLALDTSGSCDGEICRRFLRETLNLLRDISAGASSFQVLALQCDTEIRKEVLLETRDQLDDFIAEFTPAGFGGTDFRPVFHRVQQLREEGTMPRVKGLLYLSDGYGDFPDKAPDYPVVFLMPDEDEEPYEDIPPWVTALYLNQNDFTVKEAER